MKLLPNKLAWKTFIILIVGFFVLHSVALFVSTAYWRLNHNQVTPKILSNEIIKIAAVANMLSPKEIRQIDRIVRHPTIRIKLMKKPMPNATRLFSFDTQAIRKIVNERPRNIKISFELQDGYWLNVHSVIWRPDWILFGLASVMVLLFLTLIAFCIWIIRFLSVPFDQFTIAVERFGKDVSAPPLPETGQEPIREATKAFNQMQGRIRQLVDDRTQMLAAISHDLRTPITRLKLRIEQLEGKQHEKAMDDLNDMEQMITSILSFTRDYSRSESMEKFDLNALLETICDDQIDLKRDVEFKTTVKHLHFYGRLNSLKRALTNLIENAIKYGKKAEVKLQKKPDAIQIKILDDGPGIVEEELEKVFMPFYRVDTSRSPQTSGSGLGLAVARDIIHMHGGQIKLSNRKPKGLCVTVELPCGKKS